MTSPVVEEGRAAVQEDAFDSTRFEWDVGAAPTPLAKGARQTLAGLS